MSAKIPNRSVISVQEIMTAFAESTGLSGTERPPRYLWTDAFAVCNFLELYRQTGEERWRRLALRLVDQVHYVLGRHREDDARTGWISGLTEEEGREHPTRGGLRIGKPMNEREPHAPYDDRWEWERDGQYYHYLTRWMHALNRVSRTTGDPTFNIWAIELAKAAHAGFVHVYPDGSIRMYWKMSIDLTYPLVPSMGQHDPLDGWITCRELQQTAAELSEGQAPSLETEISDLALLCRGRDWATEDPLGIGGLLCDAYLLVQLILKNSRLETARLLEDLLDSSLRGLDARAGAPMVNLPAGYRLAFRELGMTIGLHAVERIEKRLEEKPEAFAVDPAPALQVKEFRRHAGLSEEIEAFWLDPRNRKVASWAEHQDINSVMLATSQAPDGYLEL